MVYLRSKEVERASHSQVAGGHACPEPPRAARKKPGLQIDVTQQNESAPHCGEEITLLSPASTVFSVLSDAQSNGRVDVRLLDKLAAARALR